MCCRPFFVLGGREFTGADALVAAREWGYLSRCEASAQEWTALATLGVASTQRDVGTVLSQERVFRRANRLFSADDLREWLARWDVQVGDWRRFLRASALRQAGSLGVSESVPCAGSDVLARALWTELVCSGTFASAVHRLAEVAAAAHAVGIHAPEGPLTSADLAALHLGESRFCSQICTPSEIRRECESHQLDWLWIRWREAEFADLDVAREAFLCVANDGRAFEEVAASAGVRAGEHASLVEELDPAVRTALVGAGRVSSSNPGRGRTVRPC